MNYRNLRNIANTLKELDGKQYAHISHLVERLDEEDIVCISKILKNSKDTYNLEVYTSTNAYIFVDLSKSQEVKNKMTEEGFIYCPFLNTWFENSDVVHYAANSKLKKYI